MSIVVIKSLNSLRHPLLAPKDCAALLSCAKDKAMKIEVKLSLVTHVLEGLPQAQHTALQRLMRYLRRLDLSSDLCPSARLAPAIGPPLLRPELAAGQGDSPLVLTQASIAVVELMVSNYEHIFSDVIPDEETSAAHARELQRRMQKLLRAKKPPGSDKGSGPQRTTSQQRRQQQQRPGRLLNPIRTMPAAAQSHNSWMLSSRPAGGNSVAAGADGDSRAGATPPVSLLPPGRRRESDENEMPPLSFRRLSPTLDQLEGHGSGGKPWRPEYPPRASSVEPPLLGGGWRESPMGSSGARLSSAVTRTSSLPAGTSRPAVPEVLRRQIELRAMQRQAPVAAPHKSPWRPPGRNDRVLGSRRPAAAAWTPALPAFRSSDGSPRLLQEQAAAGQEQCMHQTPGGVAWSVQGTGSGGSACAGPRTGGAGMTGDGRADRGLATQGSSEEVVYELDSGWPSSDGPAGLPPAAAAAGGEQGQGPVAVWLQQQQQQQQGLQEVAAGAGERMPASACAAPGGAVPDSALPAFSTAGIDFYATKMRGSSVTPEGHHLPGPGRYAGLPVSSGGEPSTRPGAYFTAAEGALASPAEGAGSSQRGWLGGWTADAGGRGVGGDITAAAAAAGPHATRVSIAQLLGGCAAAGQAPVGTGQPPVLHSVSKETSAAMAQLAASLGHAASGAGDAAGEPLTPADLQAALSGEWGIAPLLGVMNWSVPEVNSPPALLLSCCQAAWALPSRKQAWS